MASPLDQAYVSLFHGSRQSTPFAMASLADVLERIRTGTYQKEIERLRQTLASKGKKAYDLAKRDLDGFTPAGIFEPTRGKKHLLKHSRIVHGDIDHLEHVQETKALLCADPYTLYVFVSPSNTGLKFGLGIEAIGDDESYKYAWQVACDYHTTTYGLNWDPSVKDISRLCYMSWDPDLYINPAAPIFPAPARVVPPPTPKPGPSRTHTLFADQRTRYAEQAIATAVDMIDRSVMGGRHIARRKASTLLGGYIAGNILNYDQAWGALAQVVERNTDDVERSMKTIEDGLRHGQEQPITLDELEAERTAWLQANGKTTARPRTPASNNGHHLPPNPTPTPDPPTARAPDEEIHLTDVGNGLRLVNQFGEELRYVTTWKKWLIWSEGRWLIDEGGSVEWYAKHVIAGLYRWAQEKIGELAMEMPADEQLAKQRADDYAQAQAVLKWAHDSEKGTHIDLMVKRARVNPRVQVRHDALDVDPMLFQVMNGTIDLTSGQIRAPRHSDLITKRSPVHYDPDATCPRWIAVLQRAMGHPTPRDTYDAAERDRRIREADTMITYLKRLVGMSLTGDVSAQILVFFYGTGQNGKSLFLNLIRTMIGDYGMQAAPNFLLVREHEQHPTEQADLFGKRFVSTIEVEKGKYLAESLMKMLTGGERVRARRMREDHWEFPPTWKVWFCANDKPKVKGRDKATWRRIKLIPFEITIPDDEVDDTLGLKLLDELPGILNWAIEGCLEWQEHGLQEPEKVTRATEAYREETDVLAQFVRECCTLNRELKTQSSFLHKAFEVYTGLSVSPVEFADIMGTSGFKKKTTDGRVYWIGIGVNAKS